MATIREVAERAGVSVSTVSHVINETRYVSFDTRGRVLAAMAELKYQPNRLASSLRRKDKATATLGLLIPDSTNSFFAEVLRGVEDASFEAGYSVIVCNSDDNADKEINYLNVLLSKQVDGIVLVPSGAKKASLDLLKYKNSTAVVVDREIQGADLDSVVVDNERGGLTAVQYLIELGHKRIGCITGPSLFTPSAGRVEGYKRALEQAGILSDGELIVAGDFRPLSGYTAAKKLISLSPRPTAIFACNDMMAFGALRAINEAGIHVPEDISVVGFDDVALASFTYPSLTTVAQPSYEMGMRAAELLLNRLRNPGSPTRREILSPSLVIRDSCGSRKG